MYIDVNFWLWAQVAHRPLMQVTPESKRKQIKINKYNKGVRIRPSKSDFSSLSQSSLIAVLG